MYRSSYRPFHDVTDIVHRDIGVQFTQAELEAIEAADVEAQARVARDSGACDPLITELMQLRYDFRQTPELVGRIDALIEVARRQ